MADRAPGPDRRSRRRRRLRGLALATLALGALGLADAGRLQAKAWLAQVLLERNWQAQRDPARAAGPPWPWADTQVIARLRVPALAVDQLVLAGASGRNLAFGPVHVAPSAPPGRPGHLVLSGHRDTHFAFLRTLRAGMVVTVDNAAGSTTAYRVTRREWLDLRRGGLRLHPGGQRLTLATCHPDSVPGSATPLRLLVHGEAVGEPETTAGPRLSPRRSR